MASSLSSADPALLELYPLIQVRHHEASAFSSANSFPPFQKGHHLLFIELNLSAFSLAV